MFLALFLQGIPLIVPHSYCTLSCVYLCLCVCVCVHKLWILCVFSFPQDWMEGPFAWWEMIGMSPPRYFLIHFSRVTSSGRRATSLLFLSSLRIFMASAVTHTSQVCSRLRTAAKNAHHFLKALPLQNPTELQDIGSHFSSLFHSAILGGLEGWTEGTCCKSQLVFSST